jgi:putative transcriptional regulator
MDELSNKIRTLRFKNGEMTQRVLAERVGISRQTMNAIENCRHAPTVSVAIRIADVFHVAVDQLFQLDYDGKPARHKQPVNAAIDRPQPTIEKPIKIETTPEPVEETADRQFNLADLRGVLGS